MTTRKRHDRVMSALGQKQTFRRDHAMPALPLNANSGNPRVDCQFNG